MVRQMSQFYMQTSIKEKTFPNTSWEGIPFA